jgi:hypothetical protein
MNKFWKRLRAWWKEDWYRTGREGKFIVKETETYVVLRHMEQHVDMVSGRLVWRRDSSRCDEVHAMDKQFRERYYVPR